MPVHVTESTATGAGRRTVGVAEDRELAYVNTRQALVTSSHAGGSWGTLVDLATASAGLALFGVDQLGLDKVDRAILSAICERFSGGPVGLSTLAISVSEPTETVEDVYEPFLIQQGLLMRTPRGRVATPAAWAHLGLEPGPAEPPGERLFP